MPASKAASSHKAMRPWTPKTDMREQHADFAGGGGGGGSGVGGGGGGSVVVLVVEMSPDGAALTFFLVVCPSYALFSRSFSVQAVLFSSAICLPPFRPLELSLTG